MTSTIYDMGNIDIEKYNIIFNQSTDELEQTLQDLCMNYYKSIADNDGNATEVYLQEISKYTSLQIPVLNQYIQYALLLASNEVLNKIIADDVPLYNPSEMQLSFQTYKDRKAEEIIKQENLTASDVQLIIENNLARMDIYCLQLSLDIDINVLHTKPLPPHLENSRLKSMNYFGNQEEIASAKLFYSMISRYGVENEWLH